MENPSVRVMCVVCCQKGIVIGGLKIVEVLGTGSSVLGTEMVDGVGVVVCVPVSTPYEGIPEQSPRNGTRQLFVL